MLELHYSNRLGELVAPLAERLEECQRQDPLGRVTVVVSNRAVAEFLKLRLAERIGVAANVDFPFLRAYLARVISQAQEGLHVLEADELQLAVFECFRRETAGRGGAEFEPVRRYVAEVEKPEQRELRLFQLSVRVARLFREYSIVRPAMLASWRRGKTVVAEGDFAEAEKWQRGLYLALFDKDAALRPEYVSGDGQRWMLIPDALGSVKPSAIRDVLATPLHVFGLSYVGPEFIRIFKQLGELTELHIYALNPCREFWEDVRNARGSRRDGMVGRGQKLGDAFDDADDPFGLVAGNDNGALQFWGRPGREYIRLLNELTDCDFDEHFIDPESETPTLLHSLQQSILDRKPDSERASDLTAARDDGSIRFLACPGIRREVEIIADAICGMILENDESRGGELIRFHQVAIALPDAQFDAYLPHIETVLAEQYRIPLNVVNPRFNSESPVGEAVELLLALPCGRVSRDEVLRLLTHPAVAAGIADADPEQWREWCRQLGIFFGADADDFAGTYLPGDLFNWDQALKRLALGVFMAGEASGVPGTFRAGLDDEYLPCETQQSDAPGIAVMLRLARGLLSDAIHIREARLTPGEWAELMGTFVGTYVHPLDAAGERVLEKCLAALASLDCEGLRTDKVFYPVARELALSRIGGVQAQSGRYAERGVAIGSLSTLQSIPFRAIFLLGLGESLFPERDRRDPIDLRIVRRHAGDVSTAERDRYLFLESLLAARDRIVLSWVSRDAHTGDRLEPSSIVRELQFMLRARLDEKTLRAMTIEHPVSRYDLNYFPDLLKEFPELAPDDRERHAELVTFDPEARRGARMSAVRGSLRVHFENVVLPGRDTPIVDKLGDEARAKLEKTLRMIRLPDNSQGDDHDAAEIELSIAALRKFLECPLQGAARYALGMVAEDGDDGPDNEDEPLETTVLERTMMLRDAFWFGRGEEQAMTREYARAFRTSQFYGEAPVGPFAEATRQADFDKLRLFAEQAAEAGMTHLEEWQRIRVGGAREFTQVDRATQAVTLDVSVPGANGPVRRRVSLHGVVGPVSAALDRSFRCITGSEAKAHHFLDGALGAIMLTAAGEKLPRQFAVAVLGGDKDGTTVEKLTRRLAVPSRDKARQYLGALVEDLLSGNNHYFLPIEAVEQVYNPKTAGNPSQAVYKLRDGNGSLRSDYGPVRNPRRFDPPDDEEIDRILKRRFELIKGIFGK